MARRAAAGLVLLALAVAGCAQEGLTVADTCAEFNAIITDGGRTAAETTSMLKDLEGRVPPSMEEHWATVIGFFERGGSGVVEMTEDERETDVYFTDLCAEDDS